MIRLAMWAPLRRAAAIGVLALVMAGGAAPQAGAAVSQIGDGIPFIDAGGPGLFGTSTSISRNGQWMIVGAPAADGNDGAAYIYQRTPQNEWSEVRTLAAPSTAGAKFGSSVAIDEEGIRVVVGGTHDASQQGAAWVFVRDGQDWIFEQKLVGSDSAGSWQGASVAIMTAGTGVTGANIIAVGGPNASGGGAVWLWSRVNSTWGEVHKLAGANAQVSGAGQGSSVALGSDNLGSQIVVAIGAPIEGPVGEFGVTSIGATWIFTCNGTSTCNETAKLVGAGNVGASKQGSSVALNQVGDRLVVGGPDDNSEIGAIWIFERSTGTWLPEGGKRVPGGGDPVRLGYSVAMSSDGYTALAGSPGTDSYRGAAWLYVRSNGTWLPQNRIQGEFEDAPVINGAQGTSVALSGDGNFIAAGAPGFDSQNGAALTFGQSPSIGSADPAIGPAAGGTMVMIYGSGFGGITANSSVTFGGADVQSVAVQDPTRVLVTTPAHAAGAVNVTVTNSFAGTTASVFEYTPPLPVVSSLTPAAGPTAGGTTVIIGGENFTGATTVEFGTKDATSFTVNSPTEISAVAPAATHGGVSVTVTTPAGSSVGGPTYSYLPRTQVIGLSVTGATIAGGVPIVITGGPFIDVTSVKFGTTPVTSFVVDGQSEINTTVPAHAAGMVNVFVTGAAGTNVAAAGSRFTYFARPVITGINPNQGPAAGGTQVAIAGTGLQGVTGVKFGTTAATSFSASSDTTAVATAPPRAAGMVNVTLTTPGGTSAASAGARFTYTENPEMKAIAKFTGGRTDGGKPFGALVADKNGALYGTTSMGGASNKGVIFKLVPKANPNALWTKTILHHFDGDDGAKPYAGLVIDNAGNLYGTTTAGGTNNKGVVFKYTAANAKLTVLHSFKGNAADGGVPYAGLARDAQGVLYGFTSEDGRHDSGTAFEIGTNNRFTVTQHFTRGTGENSRGAPVLDKQGNLYGATVDGGAPKNGVVFKIAPNNTRTTLYTFKAANSDGHHPYGPLFTPGNNGAMFFGTANQGGPQNKGVVFDVMPPSTGIMLYSFTGASGANPYGGVVADAQTILYGTTFKGGAQNEGVVFKLIPPANNQPNWTQQLLYSFKGGPTDGANPYAGVLLGKNRTLYGTTSAGGEDACPGGCGTVFKVAY